MSKAANCVPTNVSGAALPEIWGWEGWVVLVDLLFMFIILFKDLMQVDFAMLLTLMVPVFCQIITTNEALAGFSNSAVLTVAVLYAVAEGMTSTGAMEYFMNILLGRPKSQTVAQVALMIPVGFFSAFMNNTPIVALMLPIIKNWCRKCRWPVGQFMIPLSYATIFGGTCTLIGTSTNLVVAGKAEEYYCKSVEFFALTPVGVPLALVSFTYIFLFSSKLLPNTIAKRNNNGVVSGSGSATDALMDKQFMLHCTVDADSPHVGKPANAYLTAQPEQYLSFVHRTTTTSQGVTSSERFAIQDLVKSDLPLPTLQAKDVLTFSVQHEAVDAFPLFCRNQGFTLLVNAPTTTTEAGSEDMNSAFDGAVIVQAVIPLYSALEDKTAKEVQFRSKYNCAILSIFRHGEKLPTGHLGEVVLKVGDVLVLLTNEGFSWSQEETARDLKPRPVHSRTPQEDHVLPLTGEEKEALAAGEVDREFQIAMRVGTTSLLPFTRPLGGKTIEQAGLRGLPGLFLVAVSRGDQNFYAVGSDFVLQANDIVRFIGERNSISTLRRLPGLQDVEMGQISKLDGVAPLDRRLVECVLSLKSDLIGKTVKESRFRSRFNAAIIAIHRGDGKNTSAVRAGGNERNINHLVLRAGDILIVDCGAEFVSRYRNDPNFLLVSEIEDSTPPRFGHFYLALVAILAMMISVIVFPDNVNLVFTALAAAGLMVLCRVLTPQRASSSVNWQVIITIAAAFGISNALENSLVAPIIGQALVSLANLTNTGEAGIVVCVYLATALMSIVVANNAAAVLMFPIAAQAANGAGLNPDRILLALMFAASAAFMTPFGYQTNLMVMEPGGYVFKDYVRFGFPMQVVAFFVTVVFINFDDYWYIFLPLSILFFLLAFAFKFAVLEGNGWRAFFRMFACTSCCRHRGGGGAMGADEENKYVTDANSPTNAAVEEYGNSSPRNAMGEEAGLVKV